MVPILSPKLIETLIAPVPYIIGVPKHAFVKVKRAELEDAVIIDLDEKNLQSPYKDYLPRDAFNFLRHRLKLAAGSFLSDQLPRSFLQANALIFGGYSEGFKETNGKFIWDQQTFIQRQKTSMQAYLSSLSGSGGVQYFERFIDERLHSLNSATNIEDEFELEIRKLRKITSRSPDAVQNAVSNIKENASDVIGALKDTINGKFLPLATRNENSTNFKRIRNSSRKSKRNINPLSIDTTQYSISETPNPGLKPDLTGESLRSVSDAESVNSMLDLIDFKEHTSDQSSSTIGKLSSSAKSSPNLQELGSRIDELLNLDLFSSTNSSTTGPSPATDSSAPPTLDALAPSAFAIRRSQWETFE